MIDIKLTSWGIVLGGKRFLSLPIIDNLDNRHIIPAPCWPSPRCTPRGGSALRPPWQQEWARCQCHPLLLKLTFILQTSRPSLPSTSPLLPGHKVARSSASVALIKNLSCQQFQWTAINSTFGREKPLNSVKCLPRISWSWMEYNFPVEFPCCWIPVWRICEITLEKPSNKIILKGNVLVLLSI